MNNTKFDLLWQNIWTKNQPWGLNLRTKIMSINIAALVSIHLNGHRYQNKFTHQPF